MTATTRSVIGADICVVGAGIVGLAHALEARRRGLRVVLLERNARAIGASIQNFGHAFFSSVADGEDLDCSMRSRERWLDLGARAGIDVVAGGTLVVARDEDELETVAGVVANPQRHASMLTARQAGALAPIPTEDLLGAMHGAGDLRVDPRNAVAGLAGLLEADPDAELHWNETVFEVAPGVVTSSTMTIRAPLIVLCPGPEYRSLAGSGVVDLDEVTLCKLQMLAVAAPAGRRYDPALVTGLSMIRYPAFAAQPASTRIRARLTAQRPELVAAGIHLLITQRPSGELVIGDSHDYGRTPTPFRDERLDELLLTEARRLLGADRLDVVERWLGIYPAADPERSPSEHRHFHLTTPFSGARIVEVISGLGMTMSFGHAPAVLDGLLSAP